MSQQSDAAGRIYDSMSKEAQDMPRDEFIRAVCKLSDQKGIDRDLERIMAHKRQQRNREYLARATKRAIDATGVR